MSERSRTRRPYNVPEARSVPQRYPSQGSPKSRDSCRNPRIQGICLSFQSSFLYGAIKERNSVLLISTIMPTEIPVNNAKTLSNRFLRYSAKNRLPLPDNVAF